MLIWFLLSWRVVLPNLWFAGACCFFGRVGAFWAGKLDAFGACAPIKEGYERMGGSDRLWDGVYNGFGDAGSVLNLVCCLGFFDFTAFDGWDRGILLAQYGHSHL